MSKLIVWGACGALALAACGSEPSRGPSIPAMPSTNSAAGSGAAPNTPTMNPAATAGSAGDPDDARRDRGRGLAQPDDARHADPRQPADARCGDALRPGARELPRARARRAQVQPRRRRAAQQVRAVPRRVQQPLRDPLHRRESRLRQRLPGRRVVRAPAGSRERHADPASVPRATRARAPAS